MANEMEGSDDEVIEIINLEDNFELAELKKERGNQLFKQKQYVEAISYYSEAIDLCPTTSSYYGNRAACYMMLNNFQDALEDARKSVSLDNNFVKGYLRIAKCCFALGDISSTENALSQVRKLDPNTNISLEEQKLEQVKSLDEEASKLYNKGDYRGVVYYVDRLIEHIPCAKFRLRKAESLALIGRYQEAQELANDVLHFDKQNVDAIFVRGMCLYYVDKLDLAFSHFQHVLRLAPDHQKAMAIYKKAKQLRDKKEEGNEAFKAGRLTEALQLYTTALTIDTKNISVNAKLFFNRATVNSKLGKFTEAVADCTKALELDSGYLKALMRRAMCYMELNSYEEAVRDYEQILKMDKSRENKRLLQEAKLALKASKRKDYYKILGVNRNATTDEIRKAYRKRALDFHPDRHVNATDEDKKLHEVKFKEVGEAYGILSDPKKKLRYDNGQDIEEMDSSGEFDPNTVFHTFFNEGSGASFSFSGYPGSVPEGFTFHFG